MPAKTLSYIDWILTRVEKKASCRASERLNRKQPKFTDIFADITTIDIQNHCTKETNMSHKSFRLTESSIQDFGKIGRAHV